MATAIHSSSPVQPQFTPCDWVSAICKIVHDVAMKIFQSLSCCFSSSGSTKPMETTLSNRGISVGGPLNLVAFYRGHEANNNGVTLDQILNWDDGRLEAMHNYIQWLFPLRTPSGPNPTAAILDQTTIQTFNNDPVLKNQVLRSLRRMLSFYGLQMDETTKVITRAPNFTTRAAVWLTADNHNFLRISRMIHCLHLLGLPDYSRSFFHIMQDIYRNEGRGVISDFTYQCWRGSLPRI